MYFPVLTTGIDVIDHAFQLALECVSFNIRPYKGGMLRRAQPVFIAGLDYVSPWTRDAAFNNWYGGALLAPDVAKNTLMSVVEQNDSDQLVVGGEYWDSIIWVWGAWNYYLYTGDSEFLCKAFTILENTYSLLEAQEYDSADGLFRGGACFQDGISAYPDFYGDPQGGASGIMNWLERAGGNRIETGYGLPMKALSTNCLYYQACVIGFEMEKVIGGGSRIDWRGKAAALKWSINNAFYDEASKSYRYLVDKVPDKLRQEGLGNAFAILFGIANEKQAACVIQNTHRTAHGISALWPPYERYCNNGEYPRHSGTIWPQVNSAWVEALVGAEKRREAFYELMMLAEKVVRDNGFYEIYHPDTGLPYGGMQEHPDKGEIALWDSCRGQLWCATGFVNMVLKSLFGMKFGLEGITFSPWLPKNMKDINISGLVYHGKELNVTVRGIPELSCFIAAAEIAGCNDIIIK